MFKTLIPQPVPQGNAGVSAPVNGSFVPGVDQGPRSPGEPPNWDPPLSGPWDEGDINEIQKK
jgi:hypothetical protein